MDVHGLRRAGLVLIGVLLWAAGCASAPAEGGYSWQQPHARVIETGDLQWAPRDFAFQRADTVRYIDYENGDDANSGRSKSRPWKHHPWDPDARLRARAELGNHTYVFKRGVVYRGTLVADESGTADQPIRLTSDPGWGKGEAAIYGSMKVQGGWRRADAATAPGVPEPEAVWFMDVGTDFYPRAVWEVRDGAIARIHLAREPDWEVTNPDDVKSEWYTWDTTERVSVQTEDGEQLRVWGIDREHLNAPGPDAYVGGTVWSEYVGVMGTPYPNRIEAYDPERGAIRFAGPWGQPRGHYRPIINCRYYMENLPRFLDSPGEYYYVAEGPHAGRLYVRLPEDRNPNESALELARDRTLVDIRNESHIHVSGLSFRFQNVAHWYDRWWTIAEEDPACVKALGSCQDVRVENCRFQHVVRAVHFESGGEGTMDAMAFTDNDIVHADYGPIVVRNGGGTPPAGNLYAVDILRNRLRHVGFRPMRAHHGHAVQVNFALLPHVAGNVLDRCWGAGLFVFGGKGSGQGDIERPLSRVLIHHNKATDTLLNTNDWGGIESWQGGPAYVFNNVSGNPGGYWHWKHLGRDDPAERDAATARFGFAYYLDGAFKQYVFNNIAWGKSNDLSSPLANSAGLQEITGFQNTIFNNTFYKFVAGSRRQAPHAGRNYYLGNIWSNISELYLRHAQAAEAAPEPNAADAAVAGEQDVPYDYDTMAYGDNVFRGWPRNFGVFEHTGWLYDNAEEFRLALERRDALVTGTGTEARVDVLQDPENHDFRPVAASPGMNAAGRVFVPWALYGVVGEWHFLKHPADPYVIMGEHWYMTRAHKGRGMYRHVPRHDLKAHNVEAGNFRPGHLEDWTAGALSFNGSDRYCVLTHEDMTSDITWEDGNTYPGDERRNLDVGESNFLIEVYFRAEPHTRGALVAKRADADGPGYVLDLTEEGRPRLTVSDGASSATLTASVGVADGRWHHVIAEADRSAADGASIYVDGAAANGRRTGEMPVGSLSNTGDFLVGRGPRGDYFAGTMDFLRVALGTLADARTSIEELYAWQFNGPFLRDFTGREPVGRRDAGAIEQEAP